MPATEHAFSESPPDQLYLDTDFIIACLERTDPHHQRCAPFMEQVVAHGTTLYVSSLSWLEFIHTVTRERFRELVSDDLRRQFRLERWEDASIRRAYTNHLLDSFQVLLAQCDWAEIALTSEIRAEAIELIATYNLNAHDAVHIATARDAGVVNLASPDRGYRRVDGLHLWNDRMYSQE